MASSSAPAAPRPTASTSLVHGRFLWHELLAPDVSAAARFYPPATGWTVQQLDFPGAAAPYTIFFQGEVGKAGVQPHLPGTLAPGAPALWMPYMGTDDTDATCRDALSLGATQIMPPTTLPTVGRIAVLRDPEGAQFAVIAPEPEGQKETVPVVGEFAWHEMAANDPEASLAFYTRLFGWEKKHAMDMGKDGVYQMYGRGEFTYGGFMRRVEGMPPAAWNCYLRVADLDTSIDAVKRAGGKIVMGPHEVPNDDRVAVAIDDQGAVISFVARIKGK